MSNISIKTRVLLLTFIPLLIISLILGYYLARSRIQDSENSLNERGNALARHLARESEFGLFSEDARQLGELAGIAASEDDVYEVIIKNLEGKAIANAYSRDPGIMFMNRAAHDELLMRFISPVRRSGVTISDIGEQYGTNPGHPPAQENVIGWVELKLSRSNTLARQNQIIRNIVLLTLGSSFFCALIALWMAKGIVQPIMRMSHAVDAIRKGRLNTRVHNSTGGEIGALESGFNDMADAMEKSQIRLHEEVANATNKLSLLLESLPVAVLRAEYVDQCKIFFITPSIKQLTGFDAEDFLGKGTLWLDRMHPEDREKVLRDISRLGESGSLEFEYRWQARDGGYRWFYSYLRAHVNADGPGLRIIGMWQDISEFRKISEQLNNTISILQERNSELDASREEALAASRNKASFLANMSHEIRTPLSSIIGYAAKMQSCLRNLEVTQEVRESARVISQASTQLRRIIDDILNFSKLESGAVHLDQIPFDLRTDFEDVVCMMSAELGDRKVELSLLFDSGVPTRLLGDPGRINQVLMNLLGNAIKFTRNGHVDVNVSAKDASADLVELEVSVTDTGIGMTPEAMKNIFHPFHQGDASIARRYGGTGLGLSIVSKLIELWDGEIGVESRPGSGSRFWFTLKCRKQDESDDFVVDERIKRKKILLYDDHPPALRAARNLLLGWSINLYQARTRCQMKPMIDLAAATGEPYDLVIIGAGVSDDEPGSLALNVLLTVIRDDHAIPMLLMMNRQRPVFPGRPQDHGIGLMEKPIRRDTLYQQVCRLLGIDAAAIAGAAATAAADQFRHDGIRVLLAEDNEFNRALITATLEARGLAVTQVHDGVQALQRARLEEYDLAILDIHLPGMDGAETARRIRALKTGYKTMPIIALTADIFFDTPDNLASAGIDACLLKPLNEDKLWSLINSLFTSRVGLSERSGTDADPAMEIPVSGGDAAGLNRLFEPPPPPSRDLTGILPALAASIAELDERLEAALRRNDPENLRSILHELKGVVCYFGISDLSHSVLEVEKLLGNGIDPADAPLPLHTLRKHIEDFVAAHSGRMHELDVIE